MSEWPSKGFWIGCLAIAVAYLSGYVVGQHIFDSGWIIGCIGMFVAGILSSVSRSNT